MRSLAREAHSDGTLAEYFSNMPRMTHRSVALEKLPCWTDLNTSIYLFEAGSLDTLRVGSQLAVQTMLPWESWDCILLLPLNCCNGRYTPL